jgi:hypothetical protein
MERYKNATAAEKAIFTSLAAILTPLTHINERGRELTGDKSWVKFKFNLTPNNPHIHAMEFGVKKGEVANIRLVVARPTLTTAFYKAMEKMGAKASYGGIVLHFDCTLKDVAGIMEKINTHAEKSEVVELDSKRTYCDPPAGWVKDRTGKEGIVKVEAPAVEAPTATVEAPVAAPQKVAKAS